MTFQCKITVPGSPALMSMLPVRHTLFTPNWYTGTVKKGEDREKDFPSKRYIQALQEHYGTFYSREE